MAVELLLVVILVSIWFGFYQIIKQQGRIILRLDAVEQHTPAAEPAQPQGLQIGTEFPPFTLPNLAGDRVSLKSFRGKRVLLVHWSPQCGFCDLIAPDLARLRPHFERRGVQLLLLAYGDAEANRNLDEEHGLKCPILLYKNAKIPQPLENLGTPSAYLLDAEGRVAKPLAVGSEKVPALAEQALKEQAGTESESKPLPGQRPLTASRILRDGLKAGTPAPIFTLPDMHGQNVSLKDFRGRQVLLIFSDPHCGPCNQVAPELARFHRQHGNNGLSMIMVGRGDIEENRKKTEQFGVNFPVLIQEKWRLSKEYGIFSTPVAFLIDAEGVITKDVAIGPDAIMVLAEEGLKTQKESIYELSYR
jgi:peroxiredoxin